jgi:hypothetical protein
VGNTTQREKSSPENGYDQRAELRKVLQKQKLWKQRENVKERANPEISKCQF